MKNINKHNNGLNIPSKGSTTADSLGDIEVVNTKLQYHNGTVVSPVVTEAHTQTLTNKSIDADINPISNLETDNLKSGVLITDVTLAGADDTKLPSALAVKTLVGAESTARIAADGVLQTNINANTTNLNTHINNTTGAHAASAISNVPSGNLSAGTVQAALDELQSDIDTRSTSTALSTHITDTAAHGATGAVVGTTNTQTLTNKTLTSPVINTPTGIVKSDVGLSNVDNTSDATKNAATATLTNKTLTAPILNSPKITTPSQLDVKQDTRVNLDTYAASATNGQIVFATDEKQMYQVVDGALISIGGAGIAKITAGEALVIGDCVYISSGTGNDSARTAGRLYKVDATNDDRMEVLGLVSKAAALGATAEVQLSGVLKGFTGLSSGKLYFASATTPGAITTTAPSANNQWAISVGLAISATEVFINPIASSSAIFITTSEVSFAIANNVSSAADITGLLIDPLASRGFILEYTIYRTTSSTSLAQVGQLRAVYNTVTSTWYLSDDYAGQTVGVTFSISVSGQVKYISSSLAGTSYSGVMKYNLRKTFGA